MDCVVDPPKPGDASYELFIQEKTAVLDSLALRAKMIAESFNAIPGIKCNPVQGAMYAFPQVCPFYKSFQFLVYMYFPSFEKCTLTSVSKKRFIFSNACGYTKYNFIPASFASISTKTQNTLFCSAIKLFN